MRVAVTGGAGYIGSVVSEVLLAEGHDVLVLDNLSKGHREAVDDAAVFAQVDLLDESAVAAALVAFGCDSVIHMAADSLVGESVWAPAKYYRNNVVGGLSLLAAMIAAGTTRLVFSSSAAVYGEPAQLPIREDDRQRPTNPYGATKLAFEQALPWFGQAHGLRSISLRYFNAAGATERHGERHQPETHLIPIVLEVADRRRPHVQIFGTDYPTADGTCVRDYIHVEDLARAHVLALEALEGPERCRHYNLGCGGDGFSVREVIDSAARVTGRPIDTVIEARRAGDPAVLIASSERIREELGWRPTRQELDDIVGSAWLWMQQHGR
jgi:UDP-glucose 4-epimerase